MRKKNKHINDDVLLMEGKTSSTNNTVKNVKVLGIYSKNGRVYPLDVMRNALHKYEGIVVNLDHKPNEPRSVMDRFGKLENVYMGDDGVYGDLIYNPAHPYAKAFEYFVENQPQAIGLSHAAIARTKMDRGGNETVEEIVDLESVDLVATAATNRNLFESYTQIMESLMKKDDCKPEKKEEAEVSYPIKRHYVPEDTGKKEETMADKKDLPHVSWGDKMEAVKSKEYESYEAYEKDMQEALEAVMSADIATEEKVNAIMGLMSPKDKKHEGEDKTEGALPIGLDETKDCDDKMKAEESIRTSKLGVGFKLLLEELETFRLKDSHVKKIVQVREFCAKEGLEAKLVTEAFVDALMSVHESKWTDFVRDRKSIATVSKSPISFAGDIAAGHKPLTTEELMKKLRS